MAVLLPSPVLQFCDANGKPYAGGTIATYIPGTTTPVTTWSESTGTDANTNPIVLDAAGRCTIYASGIVRMILSDSLGNLIWDQPSSTLVSAAMAPVVIAPDIPTAVALLGIPGLIAAQVSAQAALSAGALSSETARAEAAESAETTRAEGAESTLTAAIAAETARAQAAEGALSSSIASSSPTITKAGFANASSGHAHVTFGTPFPNSLEGCIAVPQGSGYVSITVNVTADQNGADIYVSQGGYTAPAGCNIYWVAVGT